MKDDSLDIVKENYFAHAKCAFCGDTERLELDLVEPYRWPPEDIWKWPSWKREGYIREWCQVLCSECYLRKKRLWKRLRVDGDAPYLGSPIIPSTLCKPPL